MLLERLPEGTAFYLGCVGGEGGSVRCGGVVLLPGRLATVGELKSWYAANWDGARLISVFESVGSTRGWKACCKSNTVIGSVWVMCMVGKWPWSVVMWKWSLFWRWRISAAGAVLLGICGPCTFSCRRTCDLAGSISNSSGYC